ncbi:MAG: hypothetical protein NTY20_01295 [Candidatus Aenigmarchaeota archaeon]|nr:hypothetical protein [Candidatus Aenigmarchaeota archaeon]
MANDLLYDSNLLQGIIVVKGDPAGRGRSCSPVYYTPLKGIFDTAIKVDKVFDCPIINYFWFKHPLDWEKITKIGDAIIAKYEKRMADFI